MYEEPNPSDWSSLLSCAREDIVVVVILIVVAVDVSVGVVVVVRLSLLMCARELA
jgi:MFS superfamily sulfate permease-like transporter